MNRQLRGVSTVVVLMFVALFVSTTSIQFFAADSLRADSRNSRTLFDSYSTKRGAILVNGSPIAESTPSDDQYKYQRKYTNGDLYSAVTGYFTIGQGNSGIESAENALLSGNSDASFFQNLNAILTGQDVQGDNVNLTIDPDVQQAAYDALGDRTGAVVAIQPKTGKVLAMVSKPGYDPNTLTSHDTKDVIAQYKALEQASGKPLQNRAIGGDLYTPGSVFKLIVRLGGTRGRQVHARLGVPEPVPPAAARDEHLHQQRRGRLVRRRPDRQAPRRDPELVQHPVRGTRAEARLRRHQGHGGQVRLRRCDRGPDARHGEPVPRTSATTPPSSC